MILGAACVGLLTLKSTKQLQGLQGCPNLGHRIEEGRCAGRAVYRLRLVKA